MVIKIWREMSERREVDSLELEGKWSDYIETNKKNESDNIFHRLFTPSFSYASSLSTLLACSIPLVYLRLVLHPVLVCTDASMLVLPPALSALEFQIIALRLCNREPVSYSECMSSYTTGHAVHNTWGCFHCIKTVALLEIGVRQQ